MNASHPQQTLQDRLVARLHEGNETIGRSYACTLASAGRGHDHCLDQDADTVVVTRAAVCHTLIRVAGTLHLRGRSVAMWPYGPDILNTLAGLRTMSHADGDPYASTVRTSPTHVWTRSTRFGAEEVQHDTNVKDHEQDLSVSTSNACLQEVWKASMPECQHAGKPVIQQTGKQVCWNIRQSTETCSR